MEKRKLTKISLLLTASIAGTAAAINGNIPAISEAFPHIHLSTIELLATIPSFFLIIATLLSGYIAKFLGYKKTMLIGISVAAISGVFPALTHNFNLILFSRALFGFGTGLFYTLLITIISNLYQSKERTKLIGLQGGFQGLGGILVISISGNLLVMGWQVSFWAYAVIFPILLLFYFFVPNIQSNNIEHTRGQQVSSDNSKSDRASKYKRSSLTILFYLAITFVVANLFMILGIKITTLMITSGYGVDFDGSLVIICLCIGSLIGGATFGRLFGYFKIYTLVIGMAILGTAMFIVRNATNVYMVTIAAVLAGFATKVILPYFINNLNDGSVRNNVLATSILLATYNVGLAVSPYTSIFIEKIVGLNSLHNLFYANGIILMIMASIIFLYAFIPSKIKK